MKRRFGLYYRSHWQNLDDREKGERAAAALTDALRMLGVLSNDRWQEISQARLAFHDALTGKLGHGWRNGRGWLTIYDGDPDQDGRPARALVVLHAQWLLLHRQHSVGMTFEAGTGDGDDGVLFSVRVPGVGLYLSAEGVLPRWARPKNPYGQPADGVHRYLPAQREIGATWHDGALWIKLWCDPDEWDSRVPVWDGRSKWRQCTIRPADLLFGRTRCATEVVREARVLIPLPEGAYPATVTVERRTWTRPRLPFWKHARISTNVEPQVPLPIPGKGENSWDCDDDAYYSLGTSATTVDGAVRSVVRTVIQQRQRYGGADWAPAAGWPAGVLS